MAQPKVTDRQRTKVEAGIVAALLLIYRGRKRQELDKLGLLDHPADVPAVAEARIRAFAADRAAKIQRGINLQLERALAQLNGDQQPGDPTPSALITSEQDSIAKYNAKWLIPMFLSWASHSALVDTYQETETPDGTPLADTTDWIWEQFSDYPDECQEAAAASPTSLIAILGITGGPPALHDHCLCTLSPA